MMFLFKFTFFDDIACRQKVEQLVAEDLEAACRGFCKLHPKIESVAVERDGPVCVVEVFSDGSGLEVTS